MATKSKKAPIGRCQRDGCAGNVYNLYRRASQAPSYADMMYTPIGPNSGGFGSGRGSVFVGYACSVCGALYAFVPDVAASQQELARRAKAKKARLKERRRQRRAACEAMREVFAKHNVTATDEELNDLVKAARSRKAEILPPLVADRDYNIEVMQKTVFINYELGNAARVAIDWQKVGDKGVQRFLSRVARIFERNGVTYSYEGDEVVCNMDRHQST